MRMFFALALFAVVVAGCASIQPTSQSSLPSASIPTDKVVPPPSDEWPAVARGTWEGTFRAINGGGTMWGQWIRIWLQQIGSAVYGSFTCGVCTGPVGVEGTVVGKNLKLGMTFVPHSGIIAVINGNDLEGTYVWNGWTPCVIRARRVLE